MCELKTFDNGVALIIGVGADLPMTVVDATAIKDILIDPERAAYKSDNVKLLTEENATKDKILSAFQNLIDNTEEDDTVIIYYSGHGGVDQQTNEYYLVPFGFKPDDRSKTGISAHELSDLINSVKSKKLIVFLDCCHAGGMARKKDIGNVNLQNYLMSADFQEKAPIDLVNNLGKGSGRFFIASSKDNEYSIAAKPYSIFTESLIEALSGAGTKENSEGYAYIFGVTGYILRKVPQRSKDFPPFKVSQNPIVKYINDATDFPICYYAGGNVKNSLHPNESSPVVVDPQNQNLTILGVIYEKTPLGEIQPIREAKVKVPTLMDSSTRTNNDGNFKLIDVPKETKIIDVFWNEQIYSLPISMDGTYKLEKEFVKSFSLTETLIKDKFWQKAIILLIGLSLFSVLIGYIVTNPTNINESRPIQFIVMVITALITSIVTFLLVPQKADYRHKAITTSTGFSLILIYLFMQFVSTNVPLLGYVLTEDGKPVPEALVTLIKRKQTLPTDKDGKFSFSAVSNDENEINIFAFNKDYGNFKINKKEKYLIKSPTPTPTIEANVTYPDSTMWEEIKDPAKLKECKTECSYDENYNTNEFTFQFFRLRLTNIIHNTHPYFYVSSEFFPESIGANICHAQGSTEDKNLFESIRNENDKKLRLFKLRASNNLITGKISFCVALPPKTKRVINDNWKVKTWSGN